MSVTECFLFNHLTSSSYGEEERFSFCGEFFRWIDANNIFSDGWTEVTKSLRAHKNNIGEHTPQKLCLTKKV